MNEIDGGSGVRVVPVIFFFWIRRLQISMHLSSKTLFHSGVCVCVGGCVWVWVGEGGPVAA